MRRSLLLKQFFSVKKRKRKMGLDARLRQAREKARLTQEQLADKAGVKQQTIDKIERGITKRPRQLDKIAKALEVSAAWLQFGYEELDSLSEEAIKLAIKWETLPEQLKNSIKAIIESSSSST